MSRAVASVVGDELYIACLSNSDEDSVGRSPDRLWLAAALSSCYGERLTVKLNGMMVQSWINQTNAYSRAQFDN